MAHLNNRFAAALAQRAQDWCSLETRLRDWIRAVLARVVWSLADALEVIEPHLAAHREGLSEVRCG